MSVYNLISFAGIFIFLGIGWLLSANRRSINKRVIVWGLALQIFFAFFVFVLPIGTDVFLFVNTLVVKILSSAAAGSEFLFGRLALPPGAINDTGETSLGFILAFQALPAIVFFSALVAILYYYRIMPLLIRSFARVFTRLMNISGAESLCAASNIFVGVESALTVRPYLAAMTRSELCTVLTAGMATVASNVLAFYVFLLQDQFPTIAGHLVSASILSAPAAIIMSKLLLPETGSPATLGLDVQPHYEKESNLFEAIINGANSGVRLIVGIIALLLAVLGLVELLDLLLASVGTVINDVTGAETDWSLERMLGYVFYPLTLALGIQPVDAVAASGIIGERIIVTEAVAYGDLAQAMQAGTLTSPRSAIIISYVLCGFTHVASMAIFVGGVAALAPSKTRVLAEIGARALLAATLACMITGCIAGLFSTDSSILLGS